MLEKSTTYMGENKTILKLAGELFQNVSVKVAATDVAAVDGVKMLAAGTVISKAGKVVDGTVVPHTDAYGLVYRDVNFTYSNGTENVPVTVFGFIDESTLPAEVAADAKTAMKMLMFL